MDDPDRLRGDLPDEDDWTVVSREDQIWAAPPTLPPALADPAPLLLNTHEMDPGAFECLVMRMARVLDGAVEARRYGNAGQAQAGLDVVGFFVERRPTVYQMKRWQVFSAKDLEDAVDLYAGGRRPFSADRIVVAVGSLARDTAIVEKLHELRERDGALRVELWDQQEISDRLRDQPGIVRVFFGDATAASFCGAETSPSQAAAVHSIAADAILRGPVVHLGLGSDLQSAEAAMADRPDVAASLLDKVARRLESEGFAPHAAPVRTLQARALTQAGRQGEAATVRLDLGWRYLHAGDPVTAQIQIREIAQWKEAPEEVVSRANTLSLSAALRHHHSVTLDQVAEAFDAAPDDDRHRADAALVLAEEAVAARRYDIVARRADIFSQIAARLLPVDPLAAARVSMCVADCDGGWHGLTLTARTTYPPPVTALIMARSARHLALVPDGHASIARWLDAIERGCLEQLNDDAATWLYALRAVRVQQGLFPDDWSALNELHRHAQALRAAGHGSVLPEPYPVREHALANLRDEKWPDALEELRRYLWQSTVTADWAGELDAHERLGDLFAKTGRPAQAIEHYVCAGERDKLVQLARELPDESIAFPRSFHTTRQWERAAAYAFAGAAADLLNDQDAKAWCSAALREIVEHPQPAPMGAPDPWMAAFNAFGSLAGVATVEEARTFLAIGRPLVPREADRYRFTDDAHVAALVGIARAHYDLRLSAVAQMVDALVISQNMAERILQASDLLRAEAHAVAPTLSAAAAEGNYFATLALIVGGVDTSACVPMARTRVAAAIAPRVHQPGQIGFGTRLTDTALMATTLPVDEQAQFARGMLDYANDRAEPAINRSEALDALRVVARGLPDPVRDELFDDVMPFAHGGREGSAGDSLGSEAADPLARFRFFPGSPPLTAGGLMAAAALGRSPDHFAAVQRVAVDLLSNADDLAFNAIAKALTFIPAERVTIDLKLLSVQASPWLRAAAAVLWTQLDDAEPEIGDRLARDTSPIVRRALAGELGSHPRSQRLREVLAVDPRRSVRRRVVTG